MHHIASGWEQNLEVQEEMLGCPGDGRGQPGRHDHHRPTGGREAPSRRADRSLVQAEAVDPVTQAAEGNAEFARGGGLVAARRLQGFLDGFALDLVEIILQRQVTGVTARLGHRWSGCKKIIGLMAAPSPRAQARSRMFSSSRTLPGKEYFWSAAMAASEMSGSTAPVSRISRPAICRARCGMSSRRSHNGGMRISMTFSR
ncbi:MAG: hypothetical protein IPG66_04340 [Hydrogenophilales bacterium]|nr:hypothetical protein [Hydrogenophilales bacterium]